MYNFGMNLGFVLVQVFSLLILVGWIVLAIACLLKLKNQALPPTAKALWALAIVVVPVLGAVAYLIVKPTQE